ncbi:MAG: beta-galactosidase [Acidobacteria bacterium]|nr:beta-galactosidase [Acidobacteriota bacterium]
MKSNRRSFLQCVFFTPVAAFGSSPLIPGALQTSQEQEIFESPLIIKYDSHCFIIQGHDALVYGSTFHYPRCPKSLWRDRLEKLQRAGFNTIESYVFWNFHEREEGKCDLSEFEEFTKLVKEMGFWMIARPGPYVCAGWHRGGIPDWVAAKRFPLRSNHPENIKWSQHWYELVLPVIQRHQITMGGPIILVQVENEYDFSPPMAPAAKLEYIRALYRFCYTSGITVPIITCWTKEARANSDPAMARIMDTCNFYPRWEVVKQVVPQLIRLRLAEATAPLGVTELQGGWFSKIGEKLSVDQDGVNGAQLNLVTKTVLEQGVTYFNYYMGSGGTNFDWAGKTMTTTYDFAAPLREPGGLWEKYYAARGICTSLKLFGNVLLRSSMVELAPTSSNPSVSVTERASGKAGVVFVREEAGAPQRFRMSFQDPFSPTLRTITAPREGELELAPHEMKMLPVALQVTGTRIRYTTAEVLAHGPIGNWEFLVIYDEPGRLAEISLASATEPKVEGDYAYNYWDEGFESVVLGIRIEKTENILFINNHLLVVVAPRERALRSWTAEFTAKFIPGVEKPEPMSVPFLTDAYQFVASGITKKGLWAEMDFQPGEHQLLALLPPTPLKCFVDGLPVAVDYERPRRKTRVNVSTPALPVEPMALQNIQFRTEKFDPQSGEWLAGPLRALEDLGEAPFGYVKYRAEFEHRGERAMFLTAFTDDVKKVFINGKLAAEASNIRREVEFPLAAYARAGANLIEIAYERFGSYNIGKELGDLSGIESVRLGADAQTATAIEKWQVQRLPAMMRGREIDPQISQMTQKDWQPEELGSVAASKEIVPAFTWCRAEFTLPTIGGGWTVPWKLIFEAERDALIYLNGKFIGRYATVGPQKEFYVPEPYLAGGVKPINVLTILLAYAAEPHVIRTLRVWPYEEFSARRTRIEFEW